MSIEALVVHIQRESLNVDTSPYHCNIVGHIPLESIDSSLAIGFYCRGKSDFNDLCLRASELIDQSNGAPLFTIVETRSSPNPASYRCTLRDDNATGTGDFDLQDEVPTDESGNFAQEDDWQLL